MKQPLVSVCIFAYNHEKYIHDCLMSVMSQSCDFAFEILIGDDLSTDSTPEIVGSLVKEYPGQFIYFRHEHRLGASGNLQSLLSKARGKYVAHLDGDDYWLPGKLSAQVRFLEDHPECASVYTNALCVSANDKFLGFFNGNSIPGIFDFRYLLERGNFLNHSSLMYRSCCSGDILAWSADFVDYKIHIKLAFSGLLGYINFPYVVYRVNTHGSMSANSGAHIRECYWEALRSALSVVKDRSLARSALSEFLAAILAWSLTARDVKGFISWWLRSCSDIKQNKFSIIHGFLYSYLRRVFATRSTRALSRFVGYSVRVFYRR